MNKDSGAVDSAAAADSVLRLDDLYWMTAYVYSRQNAARSVSATVMKLVETAGLLARLGRGGRSVNLSSEDVICKCLGWFFPLMSKLRVRSVEELIFRKYPTVCPYCHLSQHNPEVCKRPGAGELLNQHKLQQLCAQNQGLRPKTLDDWQAMFMRIYPRTAAESGRSALGLLEEIGELSEAVRVYEEYPNYVVGEAADVFSYLMGAANEHAALRQKQGEEPFSLQGAFLRNFPGVCSQCGNAVCDCPAIPPATVGRSATELSITRMELFFVQSEYELMENGKRVALRAIADSIKGAEDGESIPADRGLVQRAVQESVVEHLLAAVEREPKLSDDVREAVKAVRLVQSGSRATSALRVVKNLVTAKRPQLDTHSPLESVIDAIQRLVSQQTTSILLVAACPDEQEYLRLDKELKNVRLAIEACRYRDRFEVEQLVAPTLDDLNRALMRRSFTIVHFAGHSTPDGLWFTDLENRSVMASLEGLRDLLKLYPSVECVVLNSCEALASLDRSIVATTIGMGERIRNSWAVEFAYSFYSILGETKSLDYRKAAETARTLLAAKNIRLPLRVLENEAGAAQA